MLKRELKYLGERGDDYLLHEHLEEVNEPMYFYQFVREAKKHGLVYVGEAAMGTMAASTFPAKVQEALDRVTRDQVQREQYMDFLRNRQFRKSLLCHADRPFKHWIDPSRVRRCTWRRASSPPSPSTSSWTSRRSSRELTRTALSPRRIR